MNARPQSSHDARLEASIESAYQALMDARGIRDQRACFDQFVALIRQRSPEQIARLEIEKFGRTLNDYPVRKMQRQHTGDS